MNETSSTIMNAIAVGPTRPNMTAKHPNRAVKTNSIVHDFGSSVGVTYR